MGRRGTRRGASARTVAGGYRAGDWAEAGRRRSRTGSERLSWPRGMGGRRPAGGRWPLLAPLTAVVLAFATAGCAAEAGAAGPPPSDGIGPITFAIGSDDISWLTPVIDRWNQQNPAEKVTPLYLPEAANVQLDQLVANLQAKSDVYDVIAIDVVWTAEFASNGWIIPLPAREFDLGGFLGPAVSTAMYQRRLYAVPYYSNAHLLFYRKDILARAHEQPPTTWAQLEREARTLPARYHLAGGYAGTFAQYEGLTVNFAEAVQSAGGSIVSDSTGKVTLNTRQSAQGLGFLVDGFRAGWIPQRALTYEEVSAQDAFAKGQYLFLSDWPDVWAHLLGPDPGRTYGVTQIPGQTGPGSASLGGADLAISAFSQHQQTATRFIQYLTGRAQQEAMLENGSFPPVLKALYTDPALIRQFGYLPVLYQAISDAKPRPSITNYDQASLVISSQVFQALKGKSARQALADMQSQLSQVLRDG